MTQNPNLSLWEDVAKTDPAFTKKFQRSGGFKGTATNATYLARKATEQFGPCGIGWGVTVLDERLLDGADGVKVHRVHVELWYILDGKRGAIQHFGQTEFCGKRANGNWYTDEEAPKKSLTDAMSKALSLLGFAADVHLGLYDDNKYVASLKEEFAVEHRPIQAPQDIASNSNDVNAGAPITVNGDRIASNGNNVSAYRARKDGLWEPLVAALRACGTMEALEKWTDDHADDFEQLPRGWLEELREEYAAKAYAIKTGH